MLLTPEKSLCEKNQPIIVSRDKRSQVQHRAINPQRVFEVRQYQLDGDLVTQEKCCDFLLTNDTSKKAYFIELKEFLVQATATDMLKFLLKAVTQVLKSQILQNQTRQN